MRFGLSTAWNAFRHTSGRGMLFEIASAGFNSLELSFNLTAEMVRDIGACAASGEVRVLSLHNYCPIPEGLSRAEALPDCFSLASLDEPVRQKALLFTKRTIDTASSLSASAVVLHAGRVEIPDHTRTLIELIRAGKRDSPEFSSVRSQMLRVRRDHAKRHLEQLFQSIDELNRYAEGRAVMLGIETRFYHREIPSLDEMGMILSRFRGGAVHYWHDTGHAQLMEDLGFCAHGEFLSAYGSSLIGVHLHDYKECQDHLPPSQGIVDFRAVRQYCTPATIMILEAHHPATGEALQESRSFLAEVFNVTFDR